MTGHRFPAGERKRLNGEERRRIQPAEEIVARMGRWWPTSAAAPAMWPSPWPAG